MLKGEIIKMKTDECEEYQCGKYKYGDKVRLKTDWYSRHGLPFKKGQIFKVYFMDSDWTITNRGDFDQDDLELALE